MSCKPTYKGKRYNSLEELYNAVKAANNNIKQGIDEVFNDNSELANIGSKQLYSQYLDTIFPNSKIKDIVYHGTKSENKLEVFDENQIGALDAGYFGRGFYLTPDKQYASNYIGNKGHIESLLINLINPLETDMNQANTNISLQNNDGAIVRYGEDLNKLNEIEQDPNEIAEIVVTNSKQIHILGSKQDIEGFKQYVNNTTNNTTNNKYNYISDKDIIERINLCKK